MMTEAAIRPSDSLKHVRYEIRGRLARRAHRARAPGLRDRLAQHRQPRAFGLRTPETMRLAMIENLAEAEGYCHQKGIFPAREAVVMQQQARGITGVTVEDVFIGNGVSELIDLVLRAPAQRGRRSAGAEPGLSLVDRGRHPEPRPRRALSLPPRERLRAPTRRKWRSW